MRFLIKGDVRTLRAAAVRFVLANTLVSEPVLVLNPSLPENPLFLERLYRP